jgi:hypothetical protein
MRRMIVVTLGLVAGLMLVGCASSSPQTNGQFTPRGIPAREYLVGGGFEIFYRAPNKGTAYWVEEATAKILQTKSLEEDEDIKVEVQSLDPNDFKQMVGVEVAKARLSLYFIPRSQQVEGPFEGDGVPARKYQVGGGLSVAYRVPANGTLVWVEERGRKILETRTVEKGTAAKSDRTPEEVSQASGLPAGNVSVSLYFIPDGQ